MNQSIKLFAFTLILLVVGACSTPTNNDKVNASVDNTPNPSITITGTVLSMENGKDGYTAQVRTAEDKTYDALVSIVNLGGPDNFVRFNIGDKVTLSGPNRQSADANYLKVEKILNVSSKKHSQLLIKTTSFRGITPGDKISDHSAYIQKEEMRTGEGKFEIYRIKDFNNNPAGYFLADPSNNALVGNITVEAQTATTITGIHVGSTFGELKDKVLAVEVHGSEIEGRTYLTYNNLSYRLDVANFNYEVDSRTIPLNTKITEILINRGVQSDMELNAKYQKISENEYCWLVNDAVELYEASNRTSAKLGPHYKGEVLKVLESRIVDNAGRKQLWVNVQFTDGIKTGYEHKFADGRVTPTTGQRIGWIDGDGQVLINCK